ncbi:beta-ketoacyl-[acyl-carrier-protein] synthase family protein [Amycolatopsis nigrescens]|uniref:beta-ketoacyl-[acyl-carrier-protein] synthase family protein n=1 Tax=Amycolatopsis nigrescens TaxID=381445 RepID=UPI000368CA2D|nr:beta-ketoacyl-[acyl-carrier-protein] synthase family protein [Amycolatopsis nigrescens]
MSDRVWVTGLGMVSPGGWTAEDTWRCVVEGRSGVSKLERFPTYPSSSRVAGMVPGREGPLPADRSLSLEYGLHAAAEALRSAGLPVHDADGTGAAEDGVDVALVANHGENRLPRDGDTGKLIGIRDIAGKVAATAGTGRYSAPYGACAGSAQAIGVGLRLIQTGNADVVLAGGCDALIVPFEYMSFSSLYVMSTRECPPEEASCPFDARRDGFVLAEGAAFLVLESARHAEARGAEPLALAEGFGLRQNAYHMFAPPPDGLGLEQAMRGAIDDAKLDAGDIGWVNAHGTSTKDNDSSETLAIRKVFGAGADRLPVSSTKSQLGHTMGACGAIEAALSVQALRSSVVPPTSNLEQPDPLCDLDYVTTGAREKELDHVLSNSFGFGGHSASLVFGRVA